MTSVEKQALKDIKGLAWANRIRVENAHVIRRMNERNATFEDIKHGLTAAVSCELQGNERFRVPSSDLDGAPLVMIVVLDSEVIVVTLF